MNEYLAQTNSREDMPNPARPRTARRVAPFARSFLAGVLFLNLSFVAQAGWLQPDPDFSNYDVPLYEQITNRIKAKVLARLGDGKNTHDRYFIIPFAYQNEGNDPGFSHSFMSVIRVLADDNQSKLTAGLKKRTYKNREFEAFTISWLPHDFLTNPHLCVFEGVGSRIFPKRNTCPLSVGRDFKLDETIKLAVNAKTAVCMWGPYEISKEGFDLGVKRLRLLDGGTIKYRADDRLYRKDRIAINCFHAMAGLSASPTRPVRSGDEVVSLDGRGSENLNIPRFRRHSWIWDRRPQALPAFSNPLRTGLDGWVGPHRRKIFGALGKHLKESCSGSVSQKAREQWRCC